MLIIEFMDTALDEFVWSVPVEGFRWVAARADSKRERWLTDGQPVSLLRRQERTYRPLKEQTGLFLMFAKMEPTEEGVLKFANRFGSLLGQTTHAKQVTLREDTAAPASSWAEPLDLWQRESRDMRAATEVWAAICDNDRAGLERVLKASLLSDEAARNAPVEGPSWLWVTVNLRLAIHATLELRGDSTVPEVKLCTSPKNLLGALWLQFSLAVEGRKEFRDCVHCGEPFEVSRDGSGKRTDARFCRPVCRVNHYRGRIETAWQLHQQHLRHAEIARRLNTDKDTVKFWVSMRTKDGQKTRKK
jgi:hypothetical protein